MRLLVTSALPYANGDIHLGHLAGAYLPADIYTRYHRLKGDDIIHICGSDEHGVPVTITAEQVGISPEVFTTKYYKRMAESFKKFGIIFDNFSRTSYPLHHKTAQDFFTRIYEAGDIKPKAVEQFYCTKCKRFLADRYVEGICPYCRSPNARGDQCEACGKWLEPTILIEPKCKICGGNPMIKRTKHWFFNLSSYQKKLEGWIGGKKHWKSNVIMFCNGLFREGLKERPITRDLNWGVSVPIAEAKGKVIYVWFEALIGYISSTKEWAEKKGDANLWRDYWQNEETKLVQFLAKDNIVFHAIVWPAMLLAHKDYILPSEIPANEFLNIEGEKLSTSRNWAVWLPEYLNDFEPDPLRYTLAVNNPETKDSDFTWKDFQVRNNNELADILGNFINRTLTFVIKYFDSRIPPSHKLDEEDKKFFKKIEVLPKTVGELIDRFEFKKGLKEIMSLAGEGNRYFDYKRPWETRKNDVEVSETTIALCCSLIATLGTVFEPYLPFSAKKIRESLGIEKSVWENSADNKLTGKNVRNPGILFKKIEDEEIEKQVTKLKEMRADD